MKTGLLKFHYFILSQRFYYVGKASFSAELNLFWLIFVLMVKIFCFIFTLNRIKVYKLYFLGRLKTGVDDFVLFDNKISFIPRFNVHFIFGYETIKSSLFCGFNILESFIRRKDLLFREMILYFLKFLRGSRLKICNSGKRHFSDGTKLGDFLYI